jgi:hypothetical protein
MTDRPLTRLVVLVSLILAVVPVWAVEYMPFGDYPIHLARTYVIYHYDDVPFFRQCYELLREPIPNVAEEFVIPLFMRVTSVYVAGKISLSLSIAIFTLGVYLLSRRVPARRGMWLAVLAPFLFYCNQLFWGTLNFLVGVGLFFIVFALWDRFRANWTPLRWAAILLLAPLVYLSHLSGYVFLLIAAIIAELLDAYRERRLRFGHRALSIAPLLPPLILYKLFMSGSGRLGEVVWATLEKKAIALFPFFIHILPIDAAMLVVLAMGIVLTIYYRKSVRIDALYLTIAITFGVLYLVCPRILFTSSGADVRIILPTWILLLLAIDWGAPKQVGRILFIILLAVFIARDLALAWQWQMDSKRVADQIELLRQVPVGSRVFSEYGFTEQQGRMQRDIRPLGHAASYVTIERNAFTNAVIAVRGQQPLVLRDTLDDRMVMDTSSEHQWSYALSRFDYVWYCGAPGTYPATLRAGSDSIASKGYGELWKVRR